MSEEPAKLKYYNKYSGLTRLAYLSIVLSFFLILCECTTRTSKEISQGDDHWIVLDVKAAEQEKGILSWNFHLMRPGNYDLQILCKGDLNTFPEVKIETGSLQFSEVPSKTFVIEVEGEKQTVFQFSQSLRFEETGLQTFKLEVDTIIHQVRITPHYRHKLGFSSGKYDDQWLKMHQSPEKQASLEWLKESKYGMFIHWGLYSQMAGIWNGTRIEESPYQGPRVAEWLMSTFQIPREEYRELAKSFNPDKTFAGKIASLAKEAGMKYVVITAKHHDGFALFDSECSEFDMVDATPYRADAIKELYDACLDEGLRFGVYYSHGNDWYDGTDGDHANIKRQRDSMGILSHAQGKNLWDPSPNSFEEYLENKSYPQIRELLELMPELALIWFDGEGNITEEQSFRFYQLIYDINPAVIVNRRIGYTFGDYLDAGDNVIPSAEAKLSKHWETCGTTNNSWGYKSYDDDWKSTPELLYYLIDIASKGGNYLLNIGPDGKGIVPEASAEGLREVGQWLQVNGEAIYGTTRWKITHEGQGETRLGGTGDRANRGFNRIFSAEDFWFTAKENKVYVISLENPEKEVIIKSLKNSNGIIMNVSLLGGMARINWQQTDEALFVTVPLIENVKNGYALEITLEN